MDAGLSQFEANKTHILLGSKTYSVTHLRPSVMSLFVICVCQETPWMSCSEMTDVWMYLCIFVVLFLDPLKPVWISGSVVIRNKFEALQCYLEKSERVSWLFLILTCFKSVTFRTCRNVPWNSRGCEWAPGANNTSPSHHRASFKGPFSTHLIYFWPWTPVEQPHIQNLMNTLVK